MSIKQMLIAFSIACIWMISIYPMYVFYANKHPVIFKTNLTNRSVIESKLSLTSGAAVTIEFRSSNYFVAIVLNMFYNIPSHWKIQLFHGASNYQFIRNSTLSYIIPSDRLVLTQLPEYTGGSNSRHSYLNRLFIDISFWERTVNVDKLLFFQMDTVFCSNSPYKITDFLEWDYIGAPWPDSWINQTRGIRVGNGGFSLRSRSKSLELLKTTADRTIAYEDLYFGTNLPRVGGRVAPFEIAQRFSSEGHHNVYPMAIHKPFGKHYDEICRDCPEANLIPPFCRSKPPPYSFSM